MVGLFAFGPPLSTMAFQVPSPSYPSYYLAVKAQARGDCRGMVEHLNDFLRKYPYVPDRYPDFYLQIRLAKAQCEGRISIRGLGEGNDNGPLLLPANPPMVDSVKPDSSH